MKNFKHLIIAGLVAISASVGIAKDVPTAPKAAIYAPTENVVDNSKFNVHSENGVTSTKVKGFSSTDIALTDSVAKEVINQSVDKNWRVYSSSSNGVVTLDGFVSNQKDKVFVGEKVAKVNGVKNVQNNLIVGDVPEVSGTFVSYSFE